MLTSGELAKLCNVSLRTVQFYDKEGVVKASEIREGNRRFYDERAIEEMRFVCLCRTLGFSLQEIKKLLFQQDKQIVFSCIYKKRQELQEQSIKIEATLSQLDILLDNIHRPDVEMRYDVLEQLEMKKKIFGSVTRNQILYLFIFVFMEIILLICMSLYGFHPLFVFFIIIVGLCALIFYHARHHAYICPNCHTYFECSFIQDMTMLNNGKKGKYGRCPHCKQRANFKETFRSH